MDPILHILYRRSCRWCCVSPGNMRWIIQVKNQSSLEGLDHELFWGSVIRSMCGRFDYSTEIVQAGSRKMQHISLSDPQEMNTLAFLMLMVAFVHQLRSNLRENQGYPGIWIAYT